MRTRTCVGIYGGLSVRTSRASPHDARPHRTRPAAHTTERDSVPKRTEERARERDGVRGGGSERGDGARAGGGRTRGSHGIVSLAWIVYGACQRACAHAARTHAGAFGVAMHAAKERRALRGTEKARQTHLACPQPAGGPPWGFRCSPVT